MQPRDHGDASRTLGLLIGVALVVTVVTLPLSGEGARHSHAALLVPAVCAFAAMVVLSVAARYLGETSRVAWAVCPILAVLAITLIGLGTNDTSIGAQIFFVFCAIYGGALLPRAGAVVMTGASILGEAVLVFAQLPVRAALNDLLFVGATLVTTAYLLGRNASRLALLVAELQQRASTDSLTGLVNRGTFDVALAQAIRVGDTLHGTSLILVDIDHFKAINDEFGHPGGDEVLVQLSELVAATARSQDVVCRLGGDEMAVLMPGCAPAVGRRRAGEILAAVRGHAFTVGPATEVRVSVSAGVAHAPTDAGSPGSLYAVADAALYEAKRAGRDQVVQHRAAQQEPAR